MDKMGENNEETYLPSDLVEGGPAIGIDCGASLCKIVSKSDSNDKSTPNTMGHAPYRMVFIPSKDSDKILDTIRNACHVTRRDVVTGHVYAMGSYVDEYLGSHLQDLKMGITKHPEYDCFVDGFLYLTRHLPLTELLYSVNEELLQKTYKVVAEKNNAFRFLVHGKNPPPKKEDGTKLPLPVGQEVEFPCLLAICGTNLIFLKIEKDGNFSVIDSSNNGGTSLLGLGSLLCQSKNYEELMNLAEMGDNKEIDLFPRDLMATGSEDGYDKAIAVQTEGDVIFHFGKTLGKNIGDFTREDLAAALLQMFVHQMSQDILYAAKRANASHVFLCAGLLANHVIRDLLCCEAVNRMMFVNSLTDQETFSLGFHFLKHGTHLGALGALVRKNMDMLKSRNRDSK